MRIEHRLASLSLRHKCAEVPREDYRNSTSLMAEIDQVLSNIISLDRKIQIIEANPEKCEYKLRINKMKKDEKAAFDVDGQIAFKQDDKEYHAEIVELLDSKLDWILTLKGVVKNGCSPSTEKRPQLC